MGELLQRLQKEVDAQPWRPTERGEGIEGKVIDIQKFDGKYKATDLFVQVEDGALMLVRASDETVFGRHIAEAAPRIGDTLAVVYLGQPEGKNYKAWRVAVQRGDDTPPEEAPPEVPF